MTSFVVVPHEIISSVVILRNVIVHVVVIGAGSNTGKHSGTEDSY